jgi:hypothetical protein
VTEYVYVARFISEDTNPWDGNESYGVWRTLEAAQEKAFDIFDSDAERDGNEVSWVKHTKENYLGDCYTVHGNVECWERVEHEPGEEPEPEGSYGCYIMKEPLRD